jgi:flavin-dependent dehydrogenase
MSSPVAEKFDVVIVGAGPAGSAAAIRLANGGARVLLVERARFPREKLCGEFVSPECIRHFRELGAYELCSEDHPRIVSTIFYSQKGRSIAFASDWFGAGSNALGISRAEMDECLLEQARRAGAVVWTETAVLGATILPETGVRLRLRRNGGADEYVESTIAIDATGRKRVLSSTSTKTEKASKVAFKTHLTGAKISRSDCEIYSYSGGYGGCNPVGGERYNLCFIADAGIVKSFGSDPENVMRSVLFKNPFAKAALENATFDDEWHAVPISGYGRREPVELDRLFFVGDSAAFIDPFTGSGILLALQSAEICAKAILDGLDHGSSFKAIASDYESRYDALLGRRLRVSSLLRPASSSPRLAEVVLSLAARSERLRMALARATRFSEAPDV